LPPLSKVRCCRPKKFGRLPEGLSYHSSPRTNPSKTALSHSLFVMLSSVCTYMRLHSHYPTKSTITLASPRKRGGGLQTSERLENSALLCDISNDGIFATFLSARRWGLFPIRTINVSSYRFFYKPVRLLPIRTINEIFRTIPLAFRRGVGLPLPLHQSLMFSLIFAKEHLSLALLAPPETSL